MRGINLLYLESQLLVILPRTLSSTLRGGESECTGLQSQCKGNTYRLKAETKRPGEEETAQMAAHKLAWCLRKN